MASYSSQFMLKDPQQPDLGPASPADLAARVAKSAPLRAAQTAEILTGLPWVSSKWYNPLALSLLLLPLAAFESARKDSFLLLVWWYFAAFFGLFCLWPFAETARFMAPIAPAHLLLSWIGARRLVIAARSARTGWIATLLLAVGAGALWSEAHSSAPRGMQDWISLFFWPAAAGAWLLFQKAASSPRAASAMSAAQKILAPAAISILIVAGLAGQARHAKANLQPQPERYVNAHLREVAAWLGQAPPGAVMCGTFPYIYRMTGRRSVAFPVTGDVRAIRNSISRHGIRYLVAAGRTGSEAYFRPSEPERVAALSAAYPRLLRIAHAGKSWTIYEIVPDSPSVRTGGAADAARR